MDRNRLSKKNRPSVGVALRKESVDRNMLFLLCRPVVGLSLSVRRAWIEISWHLDGVYFGLVALRKESVDRNG